MTRQVQTYRLTWEAQQTLDLPANAKILSIQLEVSIFNLLLLFAWVDPGETQTQPRQIELYEVNTPMVYAPGIERNHLATIQNRGKIISIFERIN